MAHERTARLSASPPLFESRFLDFFSRIHPSVPAIIFLPVIVALITLGARDGQGALELVLLVLAGLALWTLTEYWLHRKFFHWEPDNAFGRRMHFIIHGVHHDHPNDKLRLVMPPGASIPLAALFFGLFYLVFGVPTAYPLFAGFLVGPASVGLPRNGSPPEPDRTRSRRPRTHTYSHTVILHPSVE